MRIAGSIFQGYTLVVMEIKRNARVLIAREKASDGTEWYVAQVLEHDIATQARSINELSYEIQRMIVGHILCCEQEGIDPWLVQSAPKAYEDMYVASEHDWTVDITRGKTDEQLKLPLPELAFRFAPGV